MSNRRARSRQSTTPRVISDEQIADLMLKLQSMLPEVRGRSSDNRASAAKVLKDTCSYIRSLQREIDGLSERLAELLAVTGMSDAQEEMIRSLLDMQ